MTEQERLTSLLIDAGETWAPVPMSKQLIKNGVIVPPCKIGDTVYYLHDTLGYGWTISNLTVIGISIIVNSNMDNTYILRCSDTEVFQSCEFDKILFFDKEDALTTLERLASVEGIDTMMKYMFNK